MVGLRRSKRKVTKVIQEKENVARIVPKKRAKMSSAQISKWLEQQYALVSSNDQESGQDLEIVELLKFSTKTNKFSAKCRISSKTRFLRMDELMNVECERCHFTPSPDMISQVQTSKHGVFCDACSESIYTQVRRKYQKRVVGRDDEASEIQHTLQNAMESKQTPPFLIAGLPGTGKSTTVKHTVESFLSKRPVIQTRRNSRSVKPSTTTKWVHLNCVHFESASVLLMEIAKFAGFDSIEDFRKYSESCSKSRMRRLRSVLILDEIDRIVHSSKEGMKKLQELFIWTDSPGSPLVLLGITNDLELLDQFPRVSSLIFRPYNHEQLKEILQVHMGSQNVDAGALELCARKVATQSGDARRALDTIAQARIYAEADGTRLSIKHVKKVMNQLFGNQAGSASILKELPRAAKIVLQAIYQLFKKTRKQGSVATLQAMLTTQQAKHGWIPPNIMWNEELQIVLNKLEQQGFIRINILSNRREFRQWQILWKCEYQDLQRGCESDKLVRELLVSG